MRAERVFYGEITPGSLLDDRCANSAVEIAGRFGSLFLPCSRAFYLVKLHHGPHSKIPRSPHWSLEEFGSSLRWPSPRCPAAKDLQHLILLALTTGNSTSQKRMNGCP